MSSKEARFVNKLRKQTSRPEIKTPIATDMFLPNQSGDHSVGVVTKTPVNDYDIANKKYVDDTAGAGGSPEGTAVKSTGETSDKYLRADGDNTCSWQTVVTAETNDLTAAVTWANVPDANITQSSVTQHVAAIDHDSLLNFAANEHFTQAAISITESQISDLSHTPEGTAVKSTGEGGGTKFLREDGDGTCSWQTPAGGGGAWTEDSTGAATGTNVSSGTYTTLTLTDTYDLWMVVIDINNDAASAGNISVRFNGVSTANYDYDELDLTSTSNATEILMSKIDVSESGKLIFWVSGRWNSQIRYVNSGLLGQWSPASVCFYGRGDNHSSPLASISATLNQQHDISIRAYGMDI